MKPADSMKDFCLHVCISALILIGAISATKAVQAYADDAWKQDNPYSITGGNHAER